MNGTVSGLSVYDLGGGRQDGAQRGDEGAPVVGRGAGAVSVHRIGGERFATVPQEAERDLAAAHGAAGQTQFEQLHPRLMGQHEFVYRFAGEHRVRFDPLVLDARHPRIGELGAGFAQQHVVEFGAVRAADQVHDGDAPAGVDLVADAGVDEEEVVVEVRYDGDERAGVAVGARFGGLRALRDQRRAEGEQQRVPCEPRDRRRLASAHDASVSAGSVGKAKSLPSAGAVVGVRPNMYEVSTRGARLSTKNKSPAEGWLCGARADGVLSATEYWWRRRESNPRPVALYDQFYILSSVI